MESISQFIYLRLSILDSPLLSLIKDYGRARLDDDLKNWQPL